MRNRIQSARRLPPRPGMDSSAKPPVAAAGKKTRLMSARAGGMPRMPVQKSLDADENDEFKLNDASPFKEPEDDEIFITREKEKMAQQKLRRIQSARPIWQKTTASSHAPLQKESGHSPMPHKPNLPNLRYTQKQRAAIQTAKSIVQTRNSSRDFGGDETSVGQTTKLGSVRFGKARV